MVSVCRKYSRRIGNEVGLPDMLLENKIDEMIERDTLKNEESIRILNIQAKQANYKKSIIYLMSLFESFMQDYISEIEGFSNKKIDINKFLDEEKRKWQSYSRSLNEPISTSTSFMNVRFSIYVLKRRYGISYPKGLSNLILELGSLRNCIVHHNGNLLLKDKGGKYLFKDTLLETIRFLNIKNEDNICDFINYEYIKKVTFELQSFIELCGRYV
ncbi:MAG: hypothetical protein ACRC1T_03415 [Clostridium chrysemydis]|uniref:hypothetical protein n=1 Tax=Clostridium chrysemydis TaxID=2665504 RepID=UPI003F3D989F